MKTDKCTKGEWKVEYPKVHLGSYRITSTDGTAGYHPTNKLIVEVAQAKYDNRDSRLTDEEIEANAAFIVKAVNNYDRLVNVLRRIVDQTGEPNVFGECSMPKYAKDQARELLNSLEEHATIQGNKNDVDLDEPIKTPLWE